MKFRVSFKTPDAVDYALDDIGEDDVDAAKAVTEKFVQYSENITVEFDTDAGTATVVQIKK